MQTVPCTKISIAFTRCLCLNGCITIEVIAKVFNNGIASLLNKFDFCNWLQGMFCAHPFTPGNNSRMLPHVTIALCLHILGHAGQH